MSTLLSESKPRARKDHDCSACEFLTVDDWWRSGKEFSFSELRSIVKAKENNWKIKKGEKYIRQALVQDGDFFQFKAIPEIDNICHKYNLYEDGF